MQNAVTTSELRDQTLRLSEEIAELQQRLAVLADNEADDAVWDIWPYCWAGRAWFFCFARFHWFHGKLREVGLRVSNGKSRRHFDEAADYTPHIAQLRLL